MVMLHAVACLNVLILNFMPFSERSQQHQP